MRLRRLDLVRYGKFTGASLDFGAPDPAAPDLHVVFGPNEAGKSTALNAWLDLLFGIEGQSAYAFQHPYATMRIGAVIETGGRLLSVSRIKGNKATLLGEGDVPVPEAVVLGPLGGLDRRGLREMFSLDDETLEAGGNSILDSEGEVGQLLFASGAGLAGFTPVLAALRKTPDPFFRPQAQKMRLADLKNDLRALEEERRRIDTDASGYKRLVQARDAAEAALAAAQRARDAPVAALQAVRRNLAALPGLHALEAVEARLAELPDLPPPPDGWAAALADLTAQEAGASGRLAAQEATLAALRAERAALVPDPAVLARRERIAAAQPLRSAHDEGVKDLPSRHDDKARLDLQIASALHRLGRAGADPAGVIPDRADVAEVRALIEVRSAVVQALALARGELARAEADLAALAPASGDDTTGDTAPLAHLYRRLQDEGPAAQLARAAEARDAAAHMLDQRLRALLPWQGTGETLAALVLPGPGVIPGWKAETARIARDQALAKADMARLDAALAGAVLPDGAAGVTLDAVAAARALRETAWAAHRAALDLASAEVFEAAMRRDDAMSAALAEGLAEGRRRAEAGVARAALLQERALASQRLVALEADALSLQGRIAEVLGAIGLPPMPPEGLEAWIAARASALDAWQALDHAGRAVARARSAVDQTCGALVAALGLAGVAAGADEGLPLLMARAAAAVDAGVERAARHQALHRAQAQVAARKTALSAAETDAARWETRWASALAAAGLPPDRGVEAAGEDLATFEALASDHRALADLTDRIAKMQANVAAYGAAVQSIAADLAMAPDMPARLGEALAARLRAAEVTDARVGDLDRRSAECLQDIAAQRAALSGVERRIATMVEGFGAADAPDLAHRLALADARQQALAEAARAAEALRQGMEVATVGAARAALSGLDRDRLAADALRLEEEAALHAQAAQATFATLAEAQRQLDAVGGDDAVQRLAVARETLLLEIAEGAHDHLVRKLGLIAVEHALRRYRDRHRSAMIEAASVAFATMTRGAYAGLATQPDGAREVLVALAAAGGSKRAQDLSKGTRFQLYLALRVAAYHERAGQGPVPPFVADDIMETFDDDRAAEAFEVMAGMARKGQVIYLTHHRHLCDIARAVSPQVRLHRLE